MAYGIIRVQKVHRNELAAMERHIDRTGHRHSNADIDVSRSGRNIEMVPHGAFRDAVDSIISSERKASSRVRKDAVVLVEGIITASPEWWNDASIQQQQSFIHDGLAFCRRFFGDSHIVHYTVHLDESTPHVHFGAVPIRDGRLSWKAFFPGRDGLREFQNRFYSEVSVRYGMDRGMSQERRKEIEGVGREHVSVATLKSRTAREVEDAINERDRAVESARQASIEEKAASERLERHLRESDRVDAEAERRLARYRAEVDAMRAAARAAMESERLAKAKRDIAVAEERTIRARISELQNAIPAIVARAEQTVFERIRRMRRGDIVQETHEAVASLVNEMILSGDLHRDAEISRTR